MFHDIAERKVRQMFESLSEGRYEPALEGLAPRFEHIFAGDHALGGTRHTAEGLRAWFERLYRLFPDLNFEILSINASGPPWNMLIVAEWIDRATPAGGGTYENRGVHLVRLEWGKLASIHAYLDTHVLTGSLNAMAANGLAEAVAPPITDAQEIRTDMRQSRRSPETATRSVGAAALGALAIGAVAVGAVAIGRVAIGRLTIGHTRIRRLEIGDLIVRRTSQQADEIPPP